MVWLQLKVDVAVDPLSAELEVSTPTQNWSSLHWAPAIVGTMNPTSAHPEANTPARKTVLNESGNPDLPALMGTPFSSSPAGPRFRAAPSGKWELLQR
jgi:hypothetical protein